MINNINQSEILCNQVKERGYSDFFILDNEAEKFSRNLYKRVQFD